MPTLKNYIFNREKPGEICCPVFDARRNQVYGAAYFKEKELVSEACYMIDEYLDILYNAVNDGNFSGKVNFYGDALKFREFIEEKFSSREFENDPASISTSSLYCVWLLPKGFKLIRWFHTGTWELPSLE